MTSIEALWLQHGTEWVLDEYGLWCNLPDDMLIKLGFPKYAAFDVFRGGSVRMPKIDCELAGYISEWLNDLDERHPDQVQMLVMFHIQRKSMVTISDITGRKRTKCSEVYGKAVSWIDSKLNDYFKLTQAQRLVYRSLMDLAS